MNSTTMDTPAKGLETLDAADAYPLEEDISPENENENDATGVALLGIANRSDHSFSNPVYPDLEEDDYAIDQQALHRIVEELQIGHDLQF